MINYSDYLNFVIQNTWLINISNLLALVGISFSFMFYFKSKKNKKPIYRIRNINLLEENISKITSVDISYQGNRIENLSISRIMIWNAGKETINNTDIAKNDKFRIEIDKEFKIFEHKLIFQKNLANGFKLTKINDNVLEIDFDYFDYEEGIIIEIYHTAIIGESIKVKGSFKGVKKIIRDNSAKEILTSLDKLSSILDFIFDYMSKKRILIPFYSILIAFLIIYTIFTFDIKDKNAILTIIATVMIVLLYLVLLYITAKTKVPKDFDLFKSEF